MPVTIKTDFDAFNRDFRDRVARSKSSLAVITNRTALAVVKKAFDVMKLAERGKVEQLGVIGNRLVKDKKSGKLKKGRNIFATGEGLLRGTNIFIAELRRRGIDPKKIPAGKMEKFVQAWIGQRLKAIGSLKVGCIPVMKKLFSTLSESQSLSYKGISSFGPARGHVDIAREGWSPKVLFDIAGGSRSRDDANIANVERYMGEALDAGFAAVMKDWESYAEKELNPILGK